MKKIVMFFCLIGASLILSSCGSKLTTDDFNDLGKGMTSKDVIDILGKPSKTITKQREVNELVDADVESYAKILALTDKSQFPDEYQKIYESAIEVAQVKVLLDEGETIKILIYRYTYDNQDEKKETADKEIYFYNDEIIAY